MGKDPWDTPAMRQWREIKAQHPECVLFFRMGDFYELFGEDATTLARDLGLTLTKRSGGIPLAGVPHHQKANYLQKAIDLGHRVAVVDQLEDPSQAKGVVDRGVTQVVTPGTLVDESLLDESLSTHLACVCFDDDERAGIAIVELSTGSFRVLDSSVEHCLDEIRRSGAGELLHAGSEAGDLPDRTKRFLERAGVSPSARPGWHFRVDEALDALEQTFGARGVEGFGLDSGMACVRAAGAIVRYLRETQAVDRETSSAASGSEFQRQRSSLSHLSVPTLIDTSGVCLIDATSLRSLEIEQTMVGGTTSGSLAGVFLGGAGKRGVIRTAMGKRLVRSWLSAPLIDETMIRERHDAVEQLVTDTALAGAMSEHLSSFGDIARILGRLALGRATARDLVSLGVGASLVGPAVSTLEGCAALSRHHLELAGVRDAIGALGAKIGRVCVEEAPAHLREGGLIRDGVDQELDEARGLERDAGAWLSEYQARLVEEHDLPALKVGYTRVFGYYIELPMAQASRAPDTLTRKQTLKNAERFITPELKAFEDKVMSAGARAVARERTLFDGLCDEARAHIDALGTYARCVAELDVLLGFAQHARERRWVRPGVDSSRSLSITQGRHPVLDDSLGTRFVPNDCGLGLPDSARFTLITGPNMAGKSTYIRQCALLVVLAQCGSFVPADSMSLGVCDRIMTRVGSDDALHKGQSTFMVEMTETARILHNATERSLVILDEIGRGTSTLDGLSLAWAVTEHLSGVSGGDDPRTLFATHYHEITELAAIHPDRVRNLHVAVREWTGEDGTQEIAFLHAIREGSADQSYGVHVAKLAGVPRAVTARAEEILGTLSVQQRGRVETAGTRERHSPSEEQMGLFPESVDHPVVDRLRELKLDTMSPLDAFDTLRALRASACPDADPQA